MTSEFGVGIFVGNDTNSTENEHENSISFEEQVADVILMTSCIVVTVIGNVLVILSVFTHRPLRNVQNFYIVSLACADLAVALVVMPFSLVNICLDGRWVFGAVFCNVWLTCDILTCTASILNLCGIAVDRYFAIHDPIAYSQRRTAGRVVVNLVVIWLVSAVISIPPLVGWNNRAGESLYDEETQVCKLTDDRGFVVYSASGSFYIPLCLMTFVYVKIFVATRTRLRARACAAATFSLAAQSVAAGTRCSGGLINWDRSVTLGREASAKSWEYEDTEDWSGKPKMERNGHCHSTVDVCELAVNELQIPDSVRDFNADSCEPRTTNNEAPPSVEEREPETGLGDGTGTGSCLRIDEIPAIQNQKNIRGSEEDEDELRNNVTAVPLPEEEKKSIPIKSLLSLHPNASDRPFFTSGSHNHHHHHRYPPKTNSKSVFRMRSFSRRSDAQFSTDFRSERKQRASQAKERRVARTMAVVMAAFVVCWLPFFLVYVIFAFCERCATGADRRLVDAVVWFGYANSTLNPVIYTIFNVDFRRAFVALLAGRGGEGGGGRLRCSNGQSTKRR